MSFELDERRKRTLVIAGIASVALVVLSFLVSLTENKDASSDTTTKIELDEPLNGEVFNDFDKMLNQENKIPNAQKFDYSYQEKKETENVDNPFANKNVTANENTTPVQEESTNAQEVERTENAVTQDTQESVPTSSYLYCGNYASTQDADSKKAQIAFLGVHSDIARYENKITLKIGPFATRDQAKAKFKSLSEQQLLTECVLVDE